MKRFSIRWLWVGLAVSFLAILACSALLFTRPLQQAGEGALTAVLVCAMLSFAAAASGLITTYQRRERQKK